MAGRRTTAAVAVLVLLVSQVGGQGTTLTQTSSLSSHKYHARIPAVNEAGRLLSHQQQSQILADIQEHHKFRLSSERDEPSTISQESPLIPQDTQAAVVQRGASPSALKNKTTHKHHAVYREKNDDFEETKPQFGAKLTRKESPRALPILNLNQPEPATPTPILHYSETASPTPPFSGFYQKSSSISPNKDDDKGINNLLLSNGVRQQLFKQLEQATSYERPTPTQFTYSTTPTTSQNTVAHSIEKTQKRQPSLNILSQQQVPLKPQQNKQQLQEQLQKQFRQQLNQRQELLRELKLAILNAGDSPPRQERTEKSVNLPLDLSNFSSLLLANGQQVKAYTQAAVVTTAKPAEASFADISKGVLPPGADFKVIRHSSDGLEELTKLPQNLKNKKVTYVFLEEQKDGTFKVQGIKGDNNTQLPGGDVNSIIKKLQEGDIKLPPQSSSIGDNSAASVVSPSYVTHAPSKAKTGHYVTVSPAKSSTARPQQVFYQTTNHLLKEQVWSPTPSTTPAEADVQFIQSITVPSLPQDLEPVVTASNNHFHNSSESAFQIHRQETNFKPYSVDVKSIKKEAAVLTPATSNNVKYDKFAPVKPQNTQYTVFQPTITPTADVSSPAHDLPRPTSYQQLDFASSQYSEQPALNSFANNLPQFDNRPEESDIPGAEPPLHEIFRSHGLFAMGKFLQESGLNNILNNTGPYTVFAPTDKAFRALLVQLGGPEKAADKFRDNPRLLSGLLLHHIIPGEFTMGSLQDEMTGVSLAGTQLRVNVYTIQDEQWNDVKVVTVNGARVVADKKDIILPHGIGHAVDRVMFPLPVGDVIATLQSDRARRFNRFLRAMDTAGLGEMLTGSTSLTLFAPVDDAFNVMEPEDVERVLTDQEMARALVLRHVAPGTLYSAGMRYYQERHSMVDGQPITLYKNGGNIKVNTASVVTFNTPTTNGVIHAINGLL